MRIDVHEPVAAGQKAAKRARKRALEGVEAARSVDLQGPADAAKAVAKRAAKRATKEATKAAGRATKKKGKRASKRALRAVVFAVVAGGVVAVAVSVARRKLASPTPVQAGMPADPFETARDLDALDAR